jgi:hypothetical protein
MAVALSIALIPVDQAVRSLTTLLLISLVAQTHRPHRSEAVPHPLLSLMKVATPPRTLNWLQWMSITFLMAGTHPIRILLPLEILGNSPLTQIPTHVKRRECAGQPRMNTIVVALAHRQYLLRPPFMQVVLVRHPIMATLPAGFQFPWALLVPTALLMHITVRQVLMVPQAIENPDGIVVIGNEGTRVDDVGLLIFMGRLHLLGR